MRESTGKEGSSWRLEIRDFAGVREVVRDLIAWHQPDPRSRDFAYALTGSMARSLANQPTDQSKYGIKEIRREKGR